MNIILIAGIAVHLLLQAGDFYTTLQAINSGKGSEGNPIIAKVMAILPSNMWWLPRLCSAAGFVVASIYAGGSVGAIIIWAANALWGYIVWNNYQIMRG